MLLDNVGEDFEEDEFLDKLEHSGKLILLLNILRECTSIGDKVWVLLCTFNDVLYYPFVQFIFPTHMPQNMI